MSLDAYWLQYDATLARIRQEKPSSFDDLKAILDTFQAPSSAQAFFPDGADDTLMSAIEDANWTVTWAAAYYHYKAQHRATGARFEYVEGDLYDQTKKDAQLGACSWFAYCENPATHTQAHPILGDVPICDRCQGIYDGLSQ